MIGIIHVLSLLSGFDLDLLLKKKKSPQIKIFLDLKAGHARQNNHSDRSHLDMIINLKVLGNMMILKHEQLLLV